MSEQLMREQLATILTTLLALVFVILLAYITIRWMGSRMTGQKGARLIRVLDRVVIGQDKCLLVVRVGQQVMLVGMSGDSVVKLSDLPELRSLTELHQADSPDFSDAMRDAIERGKGLFGKREESQ